MAAAVVRTVLNNVMSIYAALAHKRVARVVAPWRVGAHARAHDNLATKRLARVG